MISYNVDLKGKGVTAHLSLPRQAVIADDQSSSEARVLLENPKVDLRLFRHTICELEMVCCLP